MALRRKCLLLLVALALVLAGHLASPDPPDANANPLCGAVTGGIVGEAVSGAIGIGNPVGDACNSVTDAAVGTITAPIGSAIEGIGNSIFGQITDWVSGGASWLMQEVVRLSDETTTPDLTTRGFVDQYRKMATIAVSLALVALLLAVIDGLAQGENLVRVVVLNLPLALIASSVAFVVVQMLLTATDALSHAVAVSTEKNSQHLFHSAIEGLGSAAEKGGEAAAVGATEPEKNAAGAAEKAAVPLFVTFLAAIIGAFAAFFVWIELLMRDAAVYVCALFAPMAIAAAVRPRWSSILRRSAELQFVVIASKFVIVAIIGLAAGLAAENDGGVEPVLAAAALMLLACFAPMVLFKLMPSAEGAVAAAFGRRSAAGTAVGGMQLATSASVMRNTASSRWGAGGGGGASRSHSGGSNEAPSFKRRDAGGGTGSKGAVGGSSGADKAPGGAAGAAAEAPIAAERGARRAAQRLGDASVTEQSEARGSDGRPGAGAPQRAGDSAGGSREPTHSPRSGPDGEDTRREGASKGKSAPPRPQQQRSEDRQLGGESRPAGGEAPRPSSSPRRPGPKREEGDG